MLTPRTRRLALNTLLLLLSLIPLLFLSTAFYTILYNRAIPPLHTTHALHFFPSTPARTTASTTTTVQLSPGTPYTLTLHLRVPTSPANREMGNFLVTVGLGSGVRLQRMAILTYESRLVRVLRTVVGAPLYIFGWKREEEELVVVMGEKVVVARGGGVEVEVAIDRGVWVYEAVLAVDVELTGIRWWMWRHWVLMGIIGIGGFAAVALVGLGIGWGVVGRYLKVRRNGEGGLVKEEVKVNEEGGDGGEADDEDEDEVGGDSGIGTLSEGVGTGRDWRVGRRRL